MSRTIRAAGTLVATTAVAGAATLAYAWVEARSYQLRRVDVPVLRPGQRPLRVLHLSDLHLTPRHRRRVAWVQSLAALEPDLVVVTGDMISHQDAVATLLESLGDLATLPGLFVLGSNDYCAPIPIRPWRYLGGPSAPNSNPVELPWKDLVAGLTDAGWQDLSNARTRLTIDGRELDIRGVDDPHIHRDRYDEVAGPFDPSADLALGVMHAPYSRILSAMTDDGAGLLLAGHTHGGQLCVPFYGALVTNCDLPVKQAKGLSRVTRPYDAASGGDPSFGGVDGRGAQLHVSAGLGTSPYAPVRFACPPEATLLTLTAVEA